MTAKEAFQTPYVTIGKIGASCGLKGWMKIYSFTQPAENLLHYKPLFMFNHTTQSWEKIEVLSLKPHGKEFLGKFPHVHTPEAVTPYVNAEIGILKDQLPPLEADEFYYADLVGLEVINENNQSLGKVQSIFDSGASDILVVNGEGKNEILIPYIEDHFIKKVDLKARTIFVNWDPNL